MFSLWTCQHKDCTSGPTVLSVVSSPLLYATDGNVLAGLGSGEMAIEAGEEVLRMKWSGEQSLAHGWKPGGAGQASRTGAPRLANLKVTTSSH